ncbi:MAG: hypothetical protein IKL28_10725 [Lachnospiraceae bacterium]|nr:hypothetical protein [Lachnospiraceae bacterium]
MKKKTKLIIIMAVIVAFILMFPFCLRLKDGGSRVYRSIVGIYEVKDWKQMGYTEEAELSEPLGAIGTKNFPTAMSADEMLQKAIDEDFVVMYEFQFLNGEEKWKEFFETTQTGTPATIYLAKYYTMDRVGVSEEYYQANKDEYPKLFLFRLCYDGEAYTITDRPGYEEEPEMVRTYPYLVKFEGKPTSATAIFDRYEYYVLVHDKDVTWKRIEWGGFSSQMGDAIDHCRVVSKHITEENHSGR